MAQVHAGPGTINVRLKCKKRIYSCVQFCLYYKFHFKENGLCRNGKNGWKQNAMQSITSVKPITSNRKNGLCWFSFVHRLTMVTLVDVSYQYDSLQIKCHDCEPLNGIAVRLHDIFHLYVSNKFAEPKWLEERNKSQFLQYSNVIEIRKVNFILCRIAVGCFISSENCKGK